MKKMVMAVMMFGFLASFTRAVWEPIQLTADAVGSSAKGAVDWLNG